MSAQPSELVTSILGCGVKWLGFSGSGLKAFGLGFGGKVLRVQGSFRENTGEVYKSFIRQG